MGNLGREGIRSTVFIFLGFAVATVANMFFLPQWFSKSELGQVQYFISWALILSQVLSLGSSSIVVRFYHKLRDENKHQSLVSVVLLFPLVGMLVFLAVMWATGDLFFRITTEEKKILIPISDAFIILIMYTFLQCYIKSFSGLSIAMRQVWINFMLNEFVTRLFILAAYFMCFMGWITYVQMMYAIAIGFSVVLLLIVYIQGNLRFNKPGLPPREDRKSMYSYGFYALLDSGANVLVNRLDVIMIFSILGSAAVRKTYGANAPDANAEAQVYLMAVNIVTLMMMPWRSLSTSATPFVIEAIREGDMNKVGTIYRKTSLNALLTGGFIFVLIAAGIHEIFRVIPDHYEAATFSVIVLGLTRLTDMMSSVNNLIVVYSKFYRWNLYFNLMVMGMTIISNYFLIGAYGINGAAMGTVVTIVVYNVLKGLFVYRHFRLQPFHRKTPHALVALGMLVVVGYFFPTVSGSAFVNLVIKSTVLLVLFSAMILFTHISEDLRILGRKLLARIGVRLPG